VDIGDNPLDLLTENRPNLIWNFCERGFCWVDMAAPSTGERPRGCVARSLARRISWPGCGGHHLWAVCHSQL